MAAYVPIQRWVNQSTQLADVEFSWSRILQVLIPPFRNWSASGDWSPLYVSIKDYRFIYAAASGLLYGYIQRLCRRNLLQAWLLRRGLRGKIVGFWWAAQGFARPWPLTRKLGIWGVCVLGGTRPCLESRGGVHFQMHAFSPNTQTCLLISISVSYHRSGAPVRLLANLSPNVFSILFFNTLFILYTYLIII